MPLVSVIVLVWKNSEHLAHCLTALQKQTLSDFEVIVVDNGSSDSSQILRLCAKFPALSMNIERLEVNAGFAAGNNMGIRRASGLWLALLNDDAYPQPNWLEMLIQAAERNPSYTFFSSRQLQFSQAHLLDGAGDSLHITGLAWRRFYNRLAVSHGLTQAEVFSACPAAAMYSREQFLRMGGFDEDYFSYFEDVDLGFRLRLNGGKCLYVPEAVVQHVGSASTGKRSDFSVYYGYRNMIWTFFKNMPAPYLWLFLPLHMGAVLFFAAYLTLRGQGRAILKAIFDALLGMPSIWKKRKIIQSSRKVMASEVLRVMSVGLLEPLQEFVKRNRSS